VAAQAAKINQRSEAEPLPASYFTVPRNCGQDPFPAQVALWTARQGGLGTRIPIIKIIQSRKLTARRADEATVTGALNIHTSLPKHAPGG
jgi:hypothetical protein